RRSSDLLWPDFARDYFFNVQLCPMSQSRIATVQHAHWGVRYVRAFFPHDTPTPEYLSPTEPTLQAQPVTQGGRQAAWFVQLPLGQQAVLRYYRRGGVVARVFDDQYLCLVARAAERVRGE